MVSGGLKKLAQENGMKVAKGVAYGSLQGFAATMVDGADIKKITFATSFPDAELKAALLSVIEQTDIKKQYRVQNIGFSARAVQVIFLDTVGTMKKIREFLDWFIPLLRQHGATAWNICSECGTMVTGGRWLLIGGTAYYMHEACAEKTKRSILETEEAEKEQREGSYASGTVGALLGAALGAVVWALVLNMGYVASLVGLLIGWLAEKGYNLLKGKQGKGKVVILIVAVILGVLLGTFAAEAITAIGMVNDGTLPGFTVADVPGLIIMLLIYDGEYLGAIMGNVLMGLLFAGLGVFGLLKKTSDAAAGTKIVDLE